MKNSTPIRDYLDRNPDLQNAYIKEEDYRANHLIVRFPNSENIRDKELTRILKSLNMPNLGYTIQPRKNAFFYVIFPWIYEPD